MKIAINCCFGGFWLSAEAIEMLLSLGIDTTEWATGIKRNDPRLIQVIEKLGKRASSPGEDIRIVEIPDDVTNWYITDYDGIETIHEGRIWGQVSSDKN